MKRRRLPPSVFTFSSLVATCVRCGDLKQAQSFFRMMTKPQYHVTPNEVRRHRMRKESAREGKDQEEDEEETYLTLPVSQTVT